MIGSTVPVTVAVVGGTGKEGKGLAYRWAKAGYRIIIGSRAPDRAVATAAEIDHMLAGKSMTSGMSNLEAAREASIIALTVPYSAHRETLESIRPVLSGKLLIDATVPLVPGKLSKAQMPSAGSAAQEAKEILGGSVEIAAAFHSISYEHLLQDRAVDCDVLVTGTSKESRDATLRLVDAAGFRGWDAGALENSAVTEGLASVLIHLNKTYGSKHAGIRVTGLENR
jgi:NADPH-dependent F420 reductase